MKKFLLVLTLMTLVCGHAILAQSTVTGKVTDASDGSGLPGVNVVEKGTTNGTVTDFDGNYTLSVGDGATLIFSFVGYTNQEMVVGNRSVIDVGLATDVTQLSEVVVVGYGTQEKKEITSAVASLSTEDFNAGNVTDPGQLIAGKVAGLSIVTPGGDPNASPTIRLRGLSTFGANSSPLVVVDGVIGASLDNIDPNDIETIDVLKDGSAAAIYGARGSSGVILVTTKTAGKGEAATNITYNGFITIDEVANKIDVLSADEYVANGGTDFGNDTDWFEELTQTGVSYTSNLSISGALGPSTSYRASVNYRNNEGIVKGSTFERLNTRLNVQHSAVDGRLRFNINASVNNRDQESINLEAFRYATIYNPTAPIFESDVTGSTLEDESADDRATRLLNADQNFDGYFQRDLFDFFNPVALAEQQTFENQRRNFLSSFRVEYDILDELTVGVSYSQERFEDQERQFWSSFDAQTGRGQQGLAQRQSTNNFTEILSGTANYTRELTEGLDASFLVGAETQRRNNENFGVRVRQFLLDDQSFDNLGFGAIREGNQTNAFSGRTKDELNSVFARVNLTYNNFLFFSGSIRRESFSGFGEDEKSGTFPAVSLGAELTEIVDLGPFDGLKLRASFGVTGNLPPQPNLAIATFTPGNRIDLDGDPLTRGDIYTSFVQSRDPNPGLKWEEKTEINVGVDFSLFEGKLTGSMDYYTRDIEDLLFNISLERGNPNPFGATNSDGSTLFNVAGNAWANIGDLSAAGFEFAAAYNGLEFAGISWTPAINFTIYDKTVIESLSVGDLGLADIRLATPGSPGQNNNEIIRNEVGETIGNMFGPRFLGVDELGNYVLSTDDPDEFENIGNGLPDGEFGFANTFAYKNWDLSFFLRGVFGHDLYNSYRGFYENRDEPSNTWNSVITDKTDVRITDTPTFSDLYVEDATFVRLDNAQIGYRVPIQSDVFSNLRIYAAGQNLFTITDYEGIDPEVRYTDSEDTNSFTAGLAPGIERRGTYATTRSYTIGLTVNIK
ncbi:MAG: SusC/RagA family TonB-linked outer membrane protein [Bacteroidota bacterium]